MMTLRFAVVLMLSCGCAAFAQQNAGSPAQPERSHPELAHRPPPNPEMPGKMKIDVLVTDAAGQPVGGLTQEDFTLLDNKKQRPILSFRAVDGVVGAGAADPPVEVILLLDVTNTPLRIVGHERDQIEGFLRRNGGRLTQPTSLMIFDDQDVKGLPQPTRDGNQLADELKKAETTAHSVLLTEQTEPVRMTMSLNALERIAEAANTKAGRTMLIWIGAGWPMLENPHVLFTAHDSAVQFDRVVTISGELQESRVTLYSIYPTDPAVTNEPQMQHYRSFLKAAPSAARVRPGNLALPVLAIHSGGRALDAPGKLGDEIASCIAEAKAYYTLGFDPVAAKHVDEYHELQVHIDQPHLKARTTAGYYGEPPFEFHPPALSGQH